jgi:hypothetical protein
MPAKKKPDASPPQADKQAESLTESATAAPQPLDAAGEGQRLPYRVISPLHHDGHPYAIGDLVTLSRSQAMRLAAQGVITYEPAEG